MSELTQYVYVVRNQYHGNMGAFTTREVAYAWARRYEQTLDDMECRVESLPLFELGPER